MNSEILQNAIQAAGNKPAALSLLRELYDELTREIDARKPNCEMSGRCCHFEDFGHRLYVTGLELADFKLRLNSPAEKTPPPPVPRGRIQVGADALPTKNPLNVESSPPPNPPPAYRGRSLISDKGCPFQKENLCSVHPIRPLGCRIFFCDPTAKEWMENLYARFHAKVKALHQQFEIPYIYVEWREGLKNIVMTKTME